jgi:hypothetical protein
VQRRERLCELGLREGFVADEQGIEDGLVDQSADRVVSATVELV